MSANAAPLASLTIAVPFYGDDPTPLVHDIARQSDLAGWSVVLWDDGTGDDRLAASISQALQQLAIPAMLRRGSENRGRADARNRLVGLNRGDALLFLDADMRLPAPDFLSRWRAAHAAAPDAIQFGGFMPGERHDRHNLHAALARASDCPPAEERAAAPARFVFTSNLMVPAQIMAEVPFETGFRGWGWEDVDWALSAARHAHIRHIDNPAIHADLMEDADLVARFAASAENFKRLSERHPQAVQEMPVWRAARSFARARPLTAFAPLFRSAALATGLPMGVRLTALKLFRAATYAKVLA